MASLAVAVNLLFSLNLAVVATEETQTDRFVTETVERRLQMDDVVSVRAVNVQTTDGIVTLSGKVDNILAKERAAQITEAVRGVRCITNNIRVIPPALRSDLEIQDDIYMALFMDPATESFEIEVHVRNNVVSLSGTVQSRQEKQLAENVAKRVKGVIAVKNKLDIEYVVNRSDREIRSEIEQALKWNVLIGHCRIHVSVDDGEAHLTGTVDTLAERSEAIACSWVTGVHSVDARGLEVRR